MHTREVPPRHLAQVFHGHNIRITRHVVVFEEKRDVFQNGNLTLLTVKR